MSVRWEGRICYQSHGVNRILLPFSEPFLRFLSCLNTLFHANPSLQTPKLLSWVSHARSFAGIFSISTSPFSPRAYFCTCSVQQKRKTWQLSLIVAGKPFGMIAFALRGCDHRLHNAQFVLTRITSCHVRDSLVLSSFLLIKVFLCRSLFLLSPASWIATVNTVKARQPHGQTHTDPKPERRGKVHCHQRRRSE